MSTGYCVDQHKHRIFSSSQSVLWDSALVMSQTFLRDYFIHPRTPFTECILLKRSIIQVRDLGLTSSLTLALGFLPRKTEAIVTETV